MKDHIIEAKSRLSQQQLTILQTEFEKRKKSVGVAYLLWFFLSSFGMHKVYLGKIVQGILYVVAPWSAIAAFLVGVFFIGDPESGGRASIVVLVVSTVGGVAFALWWIVDLFTLHRQVVHANERIEVGILEFIEGAAAGQVVAPIDHAEVSVRSKIGLITGGLLLVGGMAFMGSRLLQSYRSDIYRVKSAKADGDSTVEQLVQEIAGANGEVKWSNIKPSEESSAPHITGVEAVIVKKYPNGRTLPINIRFVVNREADTVDMQGMEVLGKRYHSALSMAFVLEMLKAMEIKMSLEHDLEEAAKDFPQPPAVTSGTELDEKETHPLGAEAPIEGTLEGSQDVAVLVANRSRIPVREQDSKKSPVVVWMPKGSSMFQLEQAGRWFRVRTETGGEGWVSGYDVDVGK